MFLRWTHFHIMDLMTHFQMLAVMRAIFCQDAQRTLGQDDFLVVMVIGGFSVGLIIMKIIRHLPKWIESISCGRSTSDCWNIPWLGSEMDRDWYGRAMNVEGDVSLQKGHAPEPNLLKTGTLSQIDSE